MIFIIWDINPQVIPGFEYLRWYGVCWMVGFLLGYQIIRKIYQKEGLSIEDLDRLTMYVMIGAIIGARLGHILFYDPIHYFNHPIEILPIRLNPTFQFTGLAGLASHGGILGSLLALFLYTRKYPFNYLWLLDRLAIAGSVLGACIRLGNLMNSEIVGIPTTQSWAFIFTQLDQVPRHPTQIYEAISYLIIGLITYKIWQSKKFDHRNGFIFGLGITLIFIQRFIIEFLKENQVAFENQLTLNMGQALSIPLITVGVVIMIWTRRSGNEHTKKAVSASTH